MDTSTLLGEEGQNAKIALMLLGVNIPGDFTPEYIQTVNQVVSQANFVDIMKGAIFLALTAPEMNQSDSGESFFKAIKADIEHLLLEGDVPEDITRDLNNKLRVLSLIEKAHQGSEAAFWLDFYSTKDVVYTSQALTGLMVAYFVGQDLDDYDSFIQSIVDVIDTMSPNS